MKRTFKIASKKTAVYFGLPLFKINKFAILILSSFAASSFQTIINGINRFDNNLNGTSGKYGAGMSAQLADNVSLYGEVNYRQGSYVEDPVQGFAGIRIGF